MNMHASRHLSPACAVALLVLLCAACASPPVKKEVVKQEPPGLKILNILRTGRTTGLVASSATSVVLFSRTGDDYEIDSLPGLQKTGGGRLEGVRAVAFGDTPALTSIRDGGLCSLTETASGKTSGIIAASGAGRLQAAAISGSAQAGCYVSADGELFLLDFTSGNRRKLEGTFHGVKTLAIADTPPAILVGMKTGGVRRIDLASGDIRQLPASGPLTSAAFSRDRLAIGTLYWEFSLFANNSDKPLANRQIDYNPVQSLAFARLGGTDYLAVGSGQIGGGRVRLYRTPACINAEFELKPDCGEISHLKMIGRNLLAVSRDGLVALWQDKAEAARATNVLTNEKARR